MLPTIGSNLASAVELNATVQENGSENEVKLPKISYLKSLHYYVTEILRRAIINRL